MQMDFEFKAPKLPGGTSSNHKRKAVEELSNAKGKQRATAVTVTEDEDDDGAPGPAQAAIAGDSMDVENDEHEDDGSFAPGNDADYFAEEDQEGRFFGGGLSTTQKEILDIFDGQTDETELGPALNVQGVRRQLLTLERNINKNAEMRVKWAGQPDKFVDSEVNLDSSLRELLLLTQNPREFYPELTKLGIVNSLVDLLSHENVDISIAVVEILEELTDDDVAEAGGNEEEDDDEARDSESARQAVRELGTALVAAQLVETSVDNLNRLTNETEEEQDRSGVYHTLGLIENLLSLQPDLSSLIAKKTKFIEWLLKRLQGTSPTSTGAKADKGKGQQEDPALAQNKYYAAELLSIILQGTVIGKDARVVMGKKQGIEIALKVLSAYRKRDPLGADETEYMENVFDSLCSALSEPENKAIFLAEEGVELMVIMMKEKMMARARAFKVLDHALASDSGTEACERFVEVLGLKSLFSAFMNKDDKEKKKGKKSTSLSFEDEEHILSILVALLSNLASDSIPRIRLLKKFVEDGYAKIDRLVGMRTMLLNRVRKREGELEDERRLLEREGLELDEVDEYLRRLDAGLYSLQLADYILAWVCMEDDGVRDHTRTLLEEKKSSFAEVIAVLNEYQRNIGDAPTASSGDSKEGSNGQSNQPTDEATKQRMVIGHLVDYLRGC